MRKKEVNKIRLGTFLPKSWAKTCFSQRLNVLSLVINIRLELNENYKNSGIKIEECYSKKLK